MKFSLTHRTQLDVLGTSPPNVNTKEAGNKLPYFRNFLYCSTLEVLICLFSCLMNEYRPSVFAQVTKPGSFPCQARREAIFTVIASNYSDFCVKTVTFMLTSQKPLRVTRRPFFYFLRIPSLSLTFLGDDAYDNVS